MDLFFKDKRYILVNILIIQWSLPRDTMKKVKYGRIINETISGDRQEIKTNYKHILLSVMFVNFKNLIRPCDTLADVKWYL